VEASVPATANHLADTSGAVKFVIAKAQTALVVTLIGWTYGETANSPSVGATNPGGGTVTYTYYADSNNAKGALIGTTKPSAAGSYWVEASVPATANHLAGTSAAVKFVIAKAPTTLVVTLGGWTYGEAANSPSIGETNPGGGTVTYTYYADNGGAKGTLIGTTKPTTAGSYWVEASVPATANHLAGISAAVRFVIAKAPTTLVVTLSGWTYGETANTPSIGVTNPGGGTVTYTYYADNGNTKGALIGTTKPTTAGSYWVEASVPATANHLAGISAAVRFVINRPYIKFPGAAIAQPELTVLHPLSASNSLTLNPIPSRINGQAVKFGWLIDDGNAKTTADTNAANVVNWQTELTFKNLTPGTVYNIFAQTKENYNFLAGAPISIRYQLPRPDALTVTPSAITRQVGLRQMVTFSAELTGLGYLPQGVTWSVDGENLTDSSVTPDGTLNIGANESAGTLTVTATSVFDPSKTATATITLTEEPPDPAIESITISPANLILSKDADSPAHSAKLSAAVKSIGGANKAVTWSVDDEAVAEIAEDGTLTAKAAGTAIVTATSVFNPDKTAVLTVTVIAGEPEPAVVSVAVSSPGAKDAATGNPTAKVGGKRAFAANVSVTGGANTEVTWTSRDRSIATVDPTTGVVTGVAAGEAIIIATSNVDPMKYGYLAVTVTADPILALERVVNRYITRLFTFVFRITALDFSAIHKVLPSASALFCEKIR
jgi:uncharacterized protein YjdB